MAGVGAIEHIFGDALEAVGNLKDLKGPSRCRVRTSEIGLNQLQHLLQNCFVEDHVMRNPSSALAWLRGFELQDMPCAGVVGFLVPLGKVLLLMGRKTSTRLEGGQKPLQPPDAVFWGVPGL